MNLPKNEKNESLEEKEKEKEQDVDENIIIKYAVFHSCLLLLSGIQIYFICPSKKKDNKRTILYDKKKQSLCSNELNISKDYVEIQKNITKENIKMKHKNKSLKDHFLNDYNIYLNKPKKKILNEHTSYHIPVYKKNNE
ncbi:hypothetical protein PFAG_02983 [Plasmodium falciparum Santa Lucia]|uniref:Uncharacterized protein n=9 Tax=Plasmodium falciparum TaxID=5833 RepID=Q8IJB0_PLAF7|nr:conserved Plasmodium protein, unknown function [Plasmodium falciparum 3D7]ETW18101.1 hypothetical protein PFFVO_02994 [Plasmodium falciparum Vietnam Oak-Knoll (FVO)]ETW30576.1 hypothetical protein PFFCH_01988 [Plasmodium falciparum FCH/4]ETW49032.1 hypothetical protein PFMALIP_02989 [Plasmodium falciparum MaliPS096_E11]ETW56383.1 hypothetical protein PFUGPA_01558 [Plasmodium falciparum Palo Alto/Uganda]ETW61112.1 hypothetical protein PFMC_02980 [Plasmodium falciparum CAMP/Malaysia]EUT85288|eukprot:XP_001347572.1 conserved Plasmodium protein, unknown function [Plasmodium falciparum 3D7]